MKKLSKEEESGDVDVLKGDEEEKEEQTNWEKEDAESKWANLHKECNKDMKMGC